MKYISFFLLIPLSLLSGCMTPTSDDPRHRIIDISDRDGYSIGRGVLIDDGALMTATHVWRECQKIVCRYTTSLGSLSLIDDHLPDIRGDRLTLGRIGGSGFSDRVRYEIPLSGMSIYALVSRSGSWSRIDGKIITLDTTYIGYDTTLSGTLFTGAIETDIVLERGESGTPIWSLSGGLIGVMSAIDREGKRSWIVR